MSADCDEDLKQMDKLNKLEIAEQPTAPKIDILDLDAQQTTANVHCGDPTTEKCVVPPFSLAVAPFT